MWGLRRNIGLYVPIMLSLAILLLLNEILDCEGYNYCYFGAERDLCGRNKHIMCHDDLLPKQGDFMQSIPMTGKIQSQILDMHNEFRNKLASGTETAGGGGTFPKAARMRELRWDRELAYIAKRHADQCSMNHDKCHNTKRFKYSGQNLASGSLSKHISIKNILKPLNAMYNEKNTVASPTELPKAYQAGFKDSGHFTAMINDRSGFIGCALSLCSRPDKSKISYYILTCNFERTNMLGQTIYVTDGSKSASRCSDWETGRSEKYKHLCENNGKVYG